jgi:hypothetical protein
METENGDNVRSLAHDLIALQSPFQTYQVRNNSTDGGKYSSGILVGIN